jgi:hypothetical protein
MFSYRLKNFIGIYGEPEKVFIFPIYGDAIEWSVNFLYPSPGIVLIEEYRADDSNGDINVTANDRISVIFYTSPDSFLALNQDLIDLKTSVETLYQPWKRYGKYNVVTRGP